MQEAKWLSRAEIMAVAAQLTERWEREKVGSGMTPEHLLHFIANNTDPYAQRLERCIRAAYASDRNTADEDMKHFYRGEACGYSNAGIIYYDMLPGIRSELLLK